MKKKVAMMEYDNGHEKCTMVDEDSPSGKKSLPAWAEYQNVELRSRTLLTLLTNIDTEMYCLEQDIAELQDENTKLRREIGENLNAKLKLQQRELAETLMACLDVPENPSMMGTVGATLLARIRDMKSMDDVKAFIDRIGEQTKKELSKKGNDICGVE